MEQENSIFKTLNDKADKASLLLFHKNSYIMNLLNQIGSYLNKDFIKIKDFDMDANLSIYNELFDYYSSLCEEEPEKKIALHLISLILLNTDEINNNYQCLINTIMTIILTKNFLKNKKNVSDLMSQLLNQDLKLCLTKEQNTYIDLYKKLCRINIMELFELMAYFFSDNSKEELLNYSIRIFIIKCPKLIIDDSTYNSLNLKYNVFMDCLNQLLSLLFPDVDMKILEFLNNKFIIRNPSIDELTKYIKKDSSKITKKEPKMQEKSELLHSQTLYDQDQSEISWKNLNIYKKSPLERFLLKELKKINSELKKTNSKLEKLKQEMMNTKIRTSLLETDLKKIKISSLYKGIIDIFAYVYNININDFYYKKLNSLLNILDKFTNSQKIQELKDFLLDIYSYLKKGNYLAHNIEDNGNPLDLVFSLLKRGNKKEYPEIKTILVNLSVDATLKFVLNSFYSLKDKSKLIEHINFDLTTLNSMLL